MTENRFAKLRTALRGQARDAAKFVVDPMAQIAWREIGRLVDEIEAESAELRNRVEFLEERREMQRKFP